MSEIRNLLREALAYEQEAFDDDEPVNGADLVEWFAEWRERAKALLGDMAIKVGDVVRDIDGGVGVDALATVTAIEGENIRVRWHVGGHSGIWAASGFALVSDDNLPSGENTC